MTVLPELRRLLADRWIDHAYGLRLREALVCRIRGHRWQYDYEHPGVPEAAFWQGREYRECTFCERFEWVMR